MINYSHTRKVMMKPRTLSVKRGLTDPSRLSICDPASATSVEAVANVSSVSDRGGRGGNSFLWVCGGWYDVSPYSGKCFPYCADFSETNWVWLLLPCESLGLRLEEWPGMREVVEDVSNWDWTMYPLWSRCHNDLFRRLRSCD